MLNCRDAAKLLSESQDHELSFGQRFSLRMHLLLCFCPYCRGFSKQMTAFRDAIGAYRESLLRDDSDNGAQLSEDARQRILAEIQQADPDHPPTA